MPRGFIDLFISAFNILAIGRKKHHSLIAPTLLMEKIKIFVSDDCL